MRGVEESVLFLEILGIVGGYITSISRLAPNPVIPAIHTGPLSDGH